MATKMNSEPHDKDDCLSSKSSLDSSNSSLNFSEEYCQQSDRKVYYNLAQLNKSDYQTDQENILEKLNNTIEVIEEKKQRKVLKYYIGKTYVSKQKKNGRHGYRKFNNTNPHTWKNKGINSRFNYHSKQNYGKDGMVVLGAVNMSNVPAVCEETVRQEDYVLALEQATINHLRFNKGDKRCANSTSNEGRRKKGKDTEDDNFNKTEGFVVYMAFTLEEQSKETSDDQVACGRKSIESHDEQFREEQSKLKSDDNKMTPLNKMEAKPCYDENPRKRKLSFDDEVHVKPKRPLVQGTLDGRVIRETEVKKNKKTIEKSPKSLQGYHLITDFSSQKS